MKVVCFDWGGVILKICRSFPEGVQAAGLDLREGASQPDLYDVRRSLSQEYQAGRQTESEFFHAVSESFGGLYSADEIAVVHDAWLLHEYEGVAAVIDELHDNSEVHTALLSNTNGRHWARREQDFPTAGSLQTQLGSHLLGCAKPESAIYEKLEEAVSAKAEQIIFFDDLTANIDAARMRGWDAVLIDHAGDTARQIRTALQTRSILAST